MDSKKFLKDMYDDFFGIEKLRKENQKLKDELNLTDDFPAIEVNNEENKETQNQVQSQEISKKNNDEVMVELFGKIEELRIIDESKEELKKIIEYSRKYQEKIEKQYIPFNLCIYSDDDETISKIVDIINDAMMHFSYIRRADAIEVSLYNIEKVDEIEQIYNEKNSIIVIKDFENFNKQEQDFKEKFLHRIKEKHENDAEYLTIFVANNKEIINQVFEKNENIKENLFSFEIVGTKPDIQEVYQSVLKKLKENNEITEEFSIALLDYISVTYPNSSLAFPDYRNKLCEKILFNKKDKLTKESLPEYEKEKTTEEIFKELNSLVGLTKVKQVLQDLVSLMELKEKAKDDLKIKNTNLHMVFLGNPGTGKTTVARIVAEILYNLKYIKQNKLIEVSSKDLVAEYVGQTAPKTMEVIQKAMGGVLFIDEAYSLASGNGQGNSYNEEAIATLIQAMENYRDNLVVIFAGYTKEMQSFLDSNSGIVSRIGYTLEFDDYTEDELIDIFKQMLSKAGFEVTEDAINKTRDIIKEYKASKNFGNARFIRNVYEKTIIKHASNTKEKKGKKILKTIQKDDISVENLIK
ncbi:MAG: AAA family ATPase [Clostridia bacterium]|nr:AAA family ATPase [Clostridia bacterium]